MAPLLLLVVLQTATSADALVDALGCGNVVTNKATVDAERAGYLALQRDVDAKFPNAGDLAVFSPVRVSPT